MISITSAPSSRRTLSPPPIPTRLSKTSTHNTPDLRTDPDQLSGSILAGDIQRESTKAGSSRPMGSILVRKRDLSLDLRGLNRVMVRNPSMDTLVRNTGLGINESPKLMSPAPNILGTVETETRGARIGVWIPSLNDHRQQDHRGD
ncbi:hypothetical protein ACFX12_013669 [Malus domestica]